VSTVYSTAPPQVTDAPAHVPAPFGLFSVVTPTPSVAGVRWENGLIWTDEQTGELPPVLIAYCVDPSGIPLTFVQGQSQGLAKAFTVMGDFLCSPMNWSAEDAQAAATKRLLTREEEKATTQIVKQLTGDADFGGTSLTTTGTVPGDVGLLEQALAEDYGSQGVLLLSIPTVYALSQAYDLKHATNGNDLTTPLGTPIVVCRTVLDADTGVPGFTAGIVPMPVVMRGDPFTSTPDLGSYQLLDRSQNDFYAAAFRTYVTGWTVDCGASYIALDG